MNFVINNQALESLFNEIVTAYYSLYPKEALAIEEHVTRQSGGLRNPNGMSPDGHMMILAAYPQDLHSFAKIQARKRLGIDDVFRDEDNFRLFLRVYSKCRVKRKPKYNFLNDSLKTKSAKENEPKMYTGILR